MAKRQRLLRIEPADELEGPFSVEPDLEVVVGGETVWVHSVVLMLSSPVFRQMLQTDMCERESRIVRLPDKSKEEFLDFIASLQIATEKEYTDERATFLSRWADEYQVDALKRRCQEYMLEHMDVTVDSFSADMAHAVRYNLPKRIEQCLDSASNDLVAFLDRQENFDAFTSDDSNIAYMWEYICDDAGVTESEPRSASEFRTFWPFIRAAMRKQEQGCENVVPRLLSSPWSASPYYRWPSREAKEDEPCRMM